jgi:hypothetical protein
VNHFTVRDAFRINPAEPGRAVERALTERSGSPDRDRPEVIVRFTRNAVGESALALNRLSV